jgi:hypothetical protein
VADRVDAEPGNGCVFRDAAGTVPLTDEWTDSSVARPTAAPAASDSDAATNARAIAIKGRAVGLVGPVGRGVERAADA